MSSSGCSDYSVSLVDDDVIKQKVANFVECKKDAHKFLHLLDELQSLKDMLKCHEDQTEDDLRCNITNCESLIQEIHRFCGDLKQEIKGDMAQFSGLLIRKQYVGKYGDENQ